MGEKLLVVCGPTASGKTRLAIDLAERLDGEIVGADSMQIYKGMTIGTAKPTITEMRGIPHHLVDFLDPGESFSVADYVRLAKDAVAGIRARGHLPVLCGGTGLYISSLIDNIGFEDLKAPDSLRNELKTLAEEKGGEYMLERLSACDPELAAKLHPNDLGRIIRALEVYDLTGTPMSELQRRSRMNPPEYDLCMLGLGFQNRETLYERVNMRVDSMLRQGLAEEAEALLRAGHMKTASQAIGYKELTDYFAGGESLEEAAENIKRETRRLAKRQMTWFRRDSRIHWLYADEYDDYDGLLAAALAVTGKVEWVDLPKK